MKSQTTIYLEQQLAELLTPTEAAASKNMSLQLFKHYLKKPGAPKPLHVGKRRDRYFWPDEIANWNPKQPKQ